MATVSTDKLLQQAWDPAQLRRLGRALNDWAVRELTGTGSGPVRAPNFDRRAQAFLKVKGEATQATAWMRQLAAASLHINHPCYMAQQIPAPIPLAALVESAVAALNQSIAVWDMSPAGTRVDRDLMDRFKTLLGFSATAEGSLVPGGSYANLTALLAARAALAPRTWNSGAGSGVAILAGAHTHYSISRAAAIMGLGAANAFAIPLLPHTFRADPAAIAATARAARRAGFRRLILVATSGSTPTGSFDDLEAFAEAARSLSAWFHVDAAHGGGLAFSPRYRRLLRGIERADSVAFDPHKMMFMPLTAGAVLVRDGARLRGAFEQHAPYLFSPVRREVADVGPFTIACSQRFDALKIWMVWKAYGPRLFAALAEATCATARAAYEHCESSNVLEPAHRPDSNIFCFRIRDGILPSQVSAKAADALHWEIKEAVNNSGNAYISSTVLDGRRCLRIVVMNPRSAPRHVQRVMKVVEGQARQALARALPRALPRTARRTGRPA